MVCLFDFRDPRGSATHSPSCQSIGWGEEGRRAGTVTAEGNPGSHDYCLAHHFSLICGLPALNDDVLALLHPNFSPGPLNVMILDQQTVFMLFHWINVAYSKSQWRGMIFSHTAL